MGEAGVRRAQGASLNEQSIASRKGRSKFPEDLCGLRAGFRDCDRKVDLFKFGVAWRVVPGFKQGASKAFAKQVAAK